MVENAPVYVGTAGRVSGWEVGGEERGRDGGRGVGRGLWGPVKGRRPELRV